MLFKCNPAYATAIGETCGRLPEKGLPADATAEASTDPLSCVQQVLEQHAQGEQSGTQGIFHHFICKLFGHAALLTRSPLDN